MLWGFNRMNYVEAGGDMNRVYRSNLETYQELASSDSRIIAFSMHPQQIMATFFTHLDGFTSPTSESWPIWVRSDLVDPNWLVGSAVDIGDPTVTAPSPA